MVQEGYRDSQNIVGTGIFTFRKTGNHTYVAVKDNMSLQARRGKHESDLLAFLFDASTAPSKARFLSLIADKGAE